jgi:hypothetical protein
MARAKKISKEEFSSIIMEKVQDILESDRFKAFLLSPDILTAFREQVLGERPYSFGNHLTLALFGCTAVAGFHTWKKLGFVVRKGSKGVPIYRPILIKSEEEQEIDEKARTLVGFNVTYVFDVSQVKRIENAGFDAEQQKVDAFFASMETRSDFCRELTGGPEELADSLRQWVETLYPIRAEEILSGGKGYTNGREIVLKAGMSPAQSIKTLLHELAHCRLKHPGDTSLSRNAKEIQAETAAFTAAHALGLDTGSYSFDYLASWGAEIMREDNGAESFKAVLETAIVEGKRLVRDYQEFTASLSATPGVRVVETIAA